MTDDEVNVIINKMIEIYGDNMADYIQEPVRFTHQAKVAMWKLKREPKMFVYSTENL